MYNAAAAASAAHVADERHNGERESRVVKDHGSVKVVVLSAKLTAS
jgi:hypothetical protein